ncbi:Lrp/AsnC family transcriptional regulator [Arenicella sp. 4NH20-0111]|uniref:Lrp/AsnC family transcriptional regulator n=1 Tax=Arenicella sp. 4NH20-0111 TaxID=3127648 RepID=UPI00310C0C38
MPSNLELDKLDKALLSLVQMNNRSSAEALGVEVGLSTAAVQRRLRRLRDAKVIKADVAIVDRNTVGYPLQLIVHVELERESRDSLGRFREAAFTTSCVQQVFYVTGQYDFILLVIAKDMRHFELMSDELFLENKDVKAFTTSVVMGEDKSNCFVPLD